MIRCALALTRSRSQLTPRASSASISSNSTFGSTTTPLPITGVTLGESTPDGSTCRAYFSSPITTVWPALFPPWYLTTYWTRSPSRSVALPLPSSPHWAPISTIAGILFTPFTRRKPLTAQARQGLLRTESTRNALVKPSPCWAALASGRLMAMSDHVNLLGEPPATLLPPLAEAEALIASGTSPVDVAAKYPAFSLAWALLAESALGGGRPVEAYAYARTGYHRGLDALRRNGWKGHGPVPWSHEPNQGFLRCLRSLGRAAAAFGETDEVERIAIFIDDCDSSIPRVGQIAFIHAGDRPCGLAVGRRRHGDSN